jgi:prepilin-type N-terminal cleavage/methylation domain-containing protein
VIARLRARLPRGADDRGFTLAETMTVMIILGLVTAVAFAALLATRDTVTGTAVRFDQVQQAKSAVESMTRTLRSAVLPSQVYATCTTCGSAVVTAGATTVQVYSNVENPANVSGPSKVTYTVDAAGNLTETVQPPDPHTSDNFNYQYCAPVSPTCRAWTRTLARGVVVSATTPLFGYTTSAGASLAVPVSGAALADIRGVDLWVTVRVGTKVPGTTVVTHVGMPNADAIPAATATP